MLIGVPLQTVPGEAGLAVTPENATKRKAQGSTPRLQSGAGVAASAADEVHAARTTR